MCGRFAIDLTTDAMARLFRAVPDNDLPPVPDYNVCPGGMIHVMRRDGDRRRLVAMRWGFLPRWYRRENDGPLLINARAEGIADRLAFRSAARERRCLIPASGFYEWQKAEDGRRLPWYLSRRDGEALVMAGIWQDWQDGERRLSSCAIVTTAANRAVAPIHHRMPVILEPEGWALWLGERGKGAARLMRPAADGVLAVHRVGRQVNSSRAGGAGLIAPLPG